METYKNIATFYAKNQRAWRNWLKKNHLNETAVWLIIYKKDSGIPSVYYSEAVDEALCFGWIDSKPNKRDDLSYYQYFSRRNPKSNWSRVNKLKVEKLIREGKMENAGMEMIQLAQSNGSWNALNAVEELVIPTEMEQLFQQNVSALENWNKFPKSAKRGILEWIRNAKRPETKLKRITETVQLAAQNRRANY
ncbi:YdeI/OmpD-associated family protein [Flavihumibacter cheonanensis]|uniref:YdeI/OmpD-associated family protein n=1 Tax=Flavihumibacter cheonanensis TaxID=1442385 RepID=UPI001EF782C4|nr:YdeI/OmpD-associated family protein [Flavihumibacter cheonanensis]MCG7752801.1 YdeI/OmpD-associated family protein [Flavihumibacter cheonanensis]